MSQVLLDLVSSYEERISMVESMVTSAYDATATFDQSLGDLNREREGLKNELQEALARNCSFRRADFDRLMETAFGNLDRQHGEIEEERERIWEVLKAYLREQRALASALSARLSSVIQGSEGRDDLESVIAEIKTTHRDKAQRLFADLTNFQERLDVLLKEQEHENHRLQSLVSMGDSLRIGDLRQLETDRARRDRKTERKARREEVGKLLARFEEVRRGSHRQLYH